MIELKYVFTREDPQELNIKLNDVQVEKQKVIIAMIRVGEILTNTRKVVHSELRANFKLALEESKKSAGMDALELWAGARIGATYDDYIEAKSRFNYLDKVRESYECDISALQSRIRIFKETS